jgi:hypothetical protein
VIGRIIAWLTPRHIAQVCLVIQQLVIYRSAFEYLRLGPAGAAPIVTPLFVAISVAAGFAAICLLLFFVGRFGWVIAGTLVMIAILVLYKFTEMPSIPG